MLSLRRKIGESIIVNGNISVSILSIEGKQVRIGIVAPDNVNITRGKLSLPPTSSEHPDLPAAQMPSKQNR